MSATDELLDRLDGAIEDALLKHDMLIDGSRCSCGARNNMDGDDLHGHRLGVLSAAVRQVLVGNPSTIPKDSTGRDLEMFWRIKPQEDARG